MNAPRAWRQWRVEVTARLLAAGIETAAAEARWLCDEASGCVGAEWLDVEESVAPERASGALEAMVGRRESGEPLQYVLGSWSFRGLDLMVDRRVLIPRPETESVVEVALEELVLLGLRRGRRTSVRAGGPSELVADLGTGSGAIALALEAELPEVEIWAVDVSEDALAVARANVAGCAATRVRTAQGCWFEALPSDLRGRLRGVIANPPYVAPHELAGMPAEVVDYEPLGALVSGNDGLEAIAEIIAAVPEWLGTPGVLVCEIAPRQSREVVALARAAGFSEVLVRPDLAGRDRALVARLRG